MTLQFDEDANSSNSLLSHSSPSSSHQLMIMSHRHKSGTIWSGLSHIITAVIGSGLLSLSWSMSQLGWIGGPLAMVAFASLTLTSCFLLCHCYKSLDGLHSNASYLEAVHTILGKRSGLVCGIIVHINFIKIGVVYTITSSISMRAIQMSNCYHSEGHEAACAYGTTYYIIIFGMIQVLVSQIPDFHNIKWLSVIAAAMSFAYATIGSALGLARVIENGEIRGGIGGVPASNKVWLIAQALGDLAFAFPFSIVFLNIMDTLKSSPPEKVVMKKASVIAVCITTFFYMSCGGLGYAAFGNSTPGNLLTGFGFYEPYWLIDIANACVVIHLVGAYQMFSQPLFASVEGWYVSKLRHGEVKETLSLRLKLLRLCFRIVYVGLTTGISYLFPYFNEVVGVSGSIVFWPVVVYFPVEMYLVQKNIGNWTTKSFVLRLYCYLIFVVMIFAFLGSVQGLIAAKLSA